MARYQNNYYGMDDFHNEQLAHYRFKAAPRDDFQQPERTPPPVYRPYRDPTRFVNDLQTEVPRPDSGQSEYFTPKTSFDVNYTTSIKSGRAQGESKPTLLQKVLKRRPSAVDDARPAKRHKAEPSKNEPGFRKKLVQRARDVAAVMAANATERQQYQEHLKLMQEQEIEEHRRQHPDKRPEYQQAFLVEKQKVIFPGTAYEALQGPQHYQALVEEHNAEVRQHAGLQADYRNRCRLSLASGDSLPSPPPTTQGPALHLSLAERQQARLGALEQNGRMPEDDFKGLSTSQKMAIGISKMLDPFKKTKPRDDDGMEFGMFDAAPKELMEICGLCQETTQSYLVNGLCRSCQMKQRHGWI